MSGPHGTPPADDLDARQLHRKNDPTYRLPAQCTICGWSGWMTLTQGYKPKTYPGETCPYCKCSTVRAMPRWAENLVRRRP